MFFVTSSTDLAFSISWPSRPSTALVSVPHPLPPSRPRTRPITSSSSSFFSLGCRRCQALPAPLPPSIQTFELLCRFPIAGPPRYRHQPLHLAQISIVTGYSEHRADSSCCILLRLDAGRRKTVNVACKLREQTHKTMCWCVVATIKTHVMCTSYFVLKRLGGVVVMSFVHEWSPLLPPTFEYVSIRMP